MPFLIITKDQFEYISTIIADELQPILYNGVRCIIRRPSVDIWLNIERNDIIEAKIVPYSQSLSYGVFNSLSPLLLQ
jgi:hypothetical protein